MRTNTLYNPLLIDNTAVCGAFGMMIKSREFVGFDQYRMGFNGKEFDPETSTQDYGMRIYDTRLGRFLSVDPLFRDFSWNSPYSFAENDVISCIDLDGLEKYKVIGDMLYYNSDPNRDVNKDVIYPKTGVIKDKFDNKDEKKAAEILEASKEPYKWGVTIKRTTASDTEKKATDSDTHNKLDTDKKIKEAAKKAGVPPSVDIVFEGGKAKILDEPDAKSQLKVLAKFLKNHPEVNVDIKGNVKQTWYAPETGSGPDAINQPSNTPNQTVGQLMQACADAIKDILVKEYGIDPARIKTGTGAVGDTKDESTEVK